TSLAGGSVLIDERDLDAVFFFQLQIGQAIGSDIAGVNAEIRSAPEVLAGVTEGFTEGFLRAQLPPGRNRGEHRQNQYGEDCSTHVRVSSSLHGGRASSINPRLSGWRER